MTDLPYVLHLGDCRHVLWDIPDNSIDACVCDPPYALESVVKRFGKKGSAPAQPGRDGLYARQSRGFMGKAWDTGEVAHDADFWAEVLRVLKPGGHVLAFGGTRTYHRLATAIEDAGFEIRDLIAWMYGTGFPKSHNVSKSIDKHLGAERPVIGKHTKGRKATPIRDMRGGKFNANADARVDASTITGNATLEAAIFAGWGTALKPALEPICMGRKPLIGTVAENVLAYGVGGLNIDASRIPMSQQDADYIADAIGGFNNTKSIGGVGSGILGGGKVMNREEAYDSSKGRWPANVVHDGSDEVLQAFPASKAGGSLKGRESPKLTNVFDPFEGNPDEVWEAYGDSGSVARFFYCTKATKRDRNEGLDQELTEALANLHPTVKPTKLMQWLCRMVTPPGGTILDPFMGSGSTGKAAILEGFQFIGVEMDAEYMPIAEARIGAALDAMRIEEASEQDANDEMLTEAATQEEW